ncbi:MAG: hypothetical protein WC058_04965 [Phycisphaeraceae bacterium]
MLTLILAGVSADAAVERYKIEAEYLGRLTELGLATLSEGFESSRVGWRAFAGHQRSQFPVQRRQSEHHVDRGRQGHLGRRLRHPLARYDDQLQLGEVRLVGPV